MPKLDDLAFAAQAHPMDAAIIAVVAIVALGFIVTRRGAL